LKAIVKVDGKGRVTIPLYIREAIGLEPGSYVEVEVIDNKEVRIKPLSLSNEVLAEVHVRLKNTEEMHKLIDVIVSEGADIRLLRCKSQNTEGYSCILTIGVIDAELVDVIRDSLVKSRIIVNSISTIR